MRRTIIGGLLAALMIPIIPAGAQQPSSCTLRASVVFANPLSDTRQEFWGASGSGRMICSGTENYSQIADVDMQGGWLTETPAGPIGGSCTEHIGQLRARDGSHQFDIFFAGTFDAAAGGVIVDRLANSVVVGTVAMTSTAIEGNCSTAVVRASIVASIILLDVTDSSPTACSLTGDVAFTTPISDTSTTFAASGEGVLSCSLVNAFRDDVAVNLSGTSIGPVGGGCRPILGGELTASGRSQTDLLLFGTVNDDTIVNSLAEGTVIAPESAGTFTGAGVAAITPTSGDCATGVHRAHVVVILVVKDPTALAP